MKNSISLIPIFIVLIIQVYSCATEEESIVTSAIQTPLSEPETTAPTQYSLIVSAAVGGTVSSGGGTYDEGTEVTIIATANEGYRFTGWEGSNSTIDSLSLILNSNQTILAQFELIPIYTLTLTASEGGTVSIEGGEYEEGTEIQITAIPNEGFRFDGWGGMVSSENTITLTFFSDIELTPLFNPVTLSPINYGADEYWGKIVDFEPEWFFTADVPENEKLKLKETLKIVTDYFGLYGPIEIWSVGRYATLTQKRELEATFCERRSTRKDFHNRFNEYDSCISLNEFEFVQYSGINGHRSGGFHIMYHRNDWNWGDGLNLNYRHWNIQTLTHEYFHIVHLANIFNHEEQENLCGNYKPIESGGTFWIEGAAVFYAEYLQRKLRRDGMTIDNPPTVDWQGQNLKYVMKQYMNQILDHRSNCSKNIFMDFCGGGPIENNPCHPYRYGPWGVAFVNNKVNDSDAFWKTLIPLVNEIGFESAFQATYGITLEQFNSEFTEFLELPIEQQLEIIPDI
ncbi:MAG: InlB B-repeat-containing protein [Flavobacteriaceae bacterium]